MFACVADVFNKGFLKNKNVLVRVDFNFPVDDGDVPTDVSRLDVVVPTLLGLLREDATVILISHRSAGISNSFANFIPIIESKLNTRVGFVKNIPTKQYISNFSCKVFLVENLRCWDEEQNKDVTFASRLSECADLYVNEAFSVSHRQHSSLVVLPTLLPSLLGIHAYNEYSCLLNLKAIAKSPVLAVVGGKKIKDKLIFIRDFLRKGVKKSIKVFVVGAVTWPFLILNNRLSKDFIQQNYGQKQGSYIMRLAKYIMNKYSDKLILPKDFVVVNDEEKIQKKAQGYADVTNPLLVKDCGPNTLSMLKRQLMSVSTVLWSGPLGVYEHRCFSHGSLKFADWVSKLSQKGKLLSVVGGGNTSDFIKRTRLDYFFSHISTGGGACLQFLSGIKMAAIEICKKNKYK